jgi:hypothetical protein
MSGSVIPFVGESGCGKSTESRRILQQCNDKKHIIFTPDNDFGEPVLYDFNMFIEAALEARDTIIVADEFGSFVKPQNSSANPRIRLIQMQARKRNNLFIPIFDSWDNLGNWFIVNCHAVWRWQTGDPDLYKLIRRYNAKPTLTNSFRSQPKLTKHQLIKIKLKD